MADNEQTTPGSIASLLSALRALPLWILAALALTGWIATWLLLFFPAFAGLELTAFRQQWGIWIGFGTLGLSLLALARATDMAVLAYLRRARDRAARCLLRLVPLQRQSWWHLAKQRDDSFITQVSLTCQLSNTSDRPVQIVKVRLIKPRAKEVDAFAMLPSEDNPYHSPDHVVPPHGSVPASIHMMIRKALKPQGKYLRITVGLIDQFGEEYRLHRLRVRSNDRTLPPLSITDRIQIIQRFARNVLQTIKLISPPPRPPLPPMPWTFEPGSKYLAVCEAILREEKRGYAARGRITGQLGTLNVPLRSEPDSGWVKEGEVPELLWDKSKAKSLSSPNMDRLIALRKPLTPGEGSNLEAYLLTQLRRDSDFTDIGYFIFLALHRMNRTVDALRTARACLSGDKVHGYSNTLGTLSALVSHEHFNITPDLYESILECLSGDGEHDFRLREKINLATLKQLDDRKD
jgi:hypothetical protein